MTNNNSNSGKYNFVVENINEICYNISVAKDKYRNSNDDIQLMAVTKTIDTDMINFALKNGITLLGENRVQEFLSKKDEYLPLANIHFIGHLQSNKVKYIINDVSLIQSVDSIKLARTVDNYAKKNDIIMDILLQVNIGNEETKNGVDKIQVFELANQVSELENVRVKGLMTIPPLFCDEKIFDDMHKIFLDLRDKKLYNVNMDILSM
ncbi:MAG: YggS family pyridoxal phosphate-dependent enzyme, partial [Clostridiales bacterium]|nr:YggS family pyridoxal phosphate-dependent enzyme [Clostridiales bacterium]